MEIFQSVVDSIRVFASSPSLMNGATVLFALMTFALDHAELIIFLIIAIGILRWRKKIKLAEGLAKTGFRGMIVAKAFPSLKNRNIKVMGLNINGLKLGDTVVFDKDPFQTKCKVATLNLVTDKGVTTVLGVLPKNAAERQKMGPLTLTDLFSLARKGVQTVRNLQNEQEKSGGIPRPLITKNTNDRSIAMAPASASQDSGITYAAKPAPVSNEVIALEFSNPVEFERLMESQAIGQGNTKVLKAKDLKLVLRKK